MPSKCLYTFFFIFILILYDTAQAVPQARWVRRVHSAFSRLCGHKTLVLFRSSWKDLLCFPWSKINNTPITPARFFYRPHSSRQNSGCHHSQKITRQWSHLCQSHSALVPCDWSWLYAVPGSGKAFSSSARSPSDFLQPHHGFNSGSEINPQNYLAIAPFGLKNVVQFFAQASKTFLFPKFIATMSPSPHPSPWKTSVSHRPTGRLVESRC